MNIYAISVVKNEADIIEFNLMQACRWATKIFVYDNGSTDGTWQIVQGVANEKIVPWKSEDKPFYDGIRGEVYREFQGIGEVGDWWCFRLDADEFYVENPIDFLKEVPRKYHFVCTDTIEFQLTHEDIEEFGEYWNDELHLDRIRYYLPTTYSEARFFRHRNRLKWSEDRDRPKHIGIVYPKKIKVKHFQYRSPEQVKRRLESRKGSEETMKWAKHWHKEYQEILQNREALEMYDFKSFKLKGCRNTHYHKPWIYFLKRLGYFLKLLP